MSAENYQIVIPHPSDYPSFQALTYSAYAPLLKDPYTLLVAAQIGDTPIGLALAYPIAEEYKTRLLSVFVRPEYRCRGIATALVRTVEQEAREQGDTWLDAAYLAPKLALERVLARCGWDSPYVSLEVLEAPFADLHDKIAGVRLKPPPKGSVFFPWSEHTAEDRDYLRSREKQFGSALHPYAEIDSLEVGSLGVRWDGQLVGWALLHRIAPNTIRATAVYLFPEARQSNLWKHLIQRAYLRQMAMRPYEQMVVPCVPAMARFIKRFLGPQLQTVREFRICTKIL